MPLLAYLFVFLVDGLSLVFNCDIRLSGSNSNPVFIMSYAVLPKRKKERKRFKELLLLV